MPSRPWCDERGRIQVEGLRPPALADNIRRALRDVQVGGGTDDPQINPAWGEPGLTAAERLVGWNTLEVLALGAGSAERPVNAIPPLAVAHCQLRFVPGTPWQQLQGIVRSHLDAHGFDAVEVSITADSPATRRNTSKSASSNGCLPSPTLCARQNRSPTSPPREWLTRWISALRGSVLTAATSRSTSFLNTAGSQKRATSIASAKAFCLCRCLPRPSSASASARIGFATSTLVTSSIISASPEPFGPPSGSGVIATEESVVGRPCSSMAHPAGIGVPVFRA